MAGRNEDIDEIAKKWASVLSYADARVDAEATARILLNHGFDLPVLEEQDLGRYKKGFGIKAGKYRRPMYEGDTAKISINIHAEKKWNYYKTLGKGWNAQDNTVLHEAGHYIDDILEPGQLGTIERTWKLEGVNRNLVKKELSEYALTNRNEFEAELISATLRGKTFSKELLSYSNLNGVKGEKAKELLSLASGKDLCLPVDDLRQKYRDMMQVVYNNNGASFSIDILRDPAVSGFVNKHSEILDRTLTQVKMSDIMRQRLERSNYIFSGFKAFHELHEAFPSLIDSEGKRKSFEQFLDDVQTVDNTYNKNYLRAEYNFAQASAEMAGKWEEFEKDGDRYYLQYRTAGDDKVREEHALMNGITLPFSSPFWDTHFPPNGWGCRCSVVQVRKSKYPATPYEDAVRRAVASAGKDTKGMFQFNPGKQGRTFPAYNPYTISKCKTCPRANGNSATNLAKLPENELCKACKLYFRCEEKRYKAIKEYPSGGKIIVHELVNPKDSDYHKLMEIAEFFSQKGREVRLAPKMSRPKKFVYQNIYHSLIGTEFDGKCPDLLIDGKWYEHEGFTTDNAKRAFKNMVKHGLKQSNRIIIDRPDLTENYMIRSINTHIRLGKNVEEVWLRETNGKITQLFEMTES